VSFFIEYPGAPTPPMRDTEALRRAIRRHLLDLDDAAPDFLAALLESYLETTPTLLESLVAHRNRRDAPGLHNAAHSLKSSSQVIGHMRLASYCKALEASSRDAPFSEPMAGYVELIVAEYRVAQPVLTGLYEAFLAEANADR